MLRNGQANKLIHITYNSNGTFHEKSKQVFEIVEIKNERVDNWVLSYLSPPRKIMVRTRIRVRAIRAIRVRVRVRVRAIRAIRVNPNPNSPNPNPNPVQSCK